MALRPSSNPISRGKRCVPPSPGMSPSLSSGRANDDLAEQTRALQASASSSPPPKQTPSIAATTGLEPRSNTAYSSSSSDAGGGPSIFPSARPPLPFSSCCCRRANSAMSAPEEKKPFDDSPYNKIAFTFGSLCARATAPHSASRSAPESALTGGFANRTVNTELAASSTLVTSISSTSQRYLSSTDTQPTVKKRKKMHHR
mmetsp:Transcript_2204/g.5967  ORF Transcript_2204/g.5967 Transcript_2204/m.5967 type:complete len:201 (+) Transcript_2204:5283-5885(+)